MFQWLKRWKEDATTPMKDTRPQTAGWAIEEAQSKIGKHDIRPGVYISERESLLLPVGSVVNGLDSQRGTVMPEPVPGRNVLNAYLLVSNREDVNSGSSRYYVLFIPEGSYIPLHPEADLAPLHLRVPLKEFKPAAFGYPLPDTGDHFHYN